MLLTAVVLAGFIGSGCDDEGPPIVAAQLGLSAIAPATGSASGGEQIVIVGNSIREGATVTIQGNDAEVVEVPGTTVIIVLTPPGRDGVADVTVTNPDGTTATLEAAFTYTKVDTGTNNGTVTPDPLAVTRALPDTISTIGGETIVLLGTGFAPEATAYFGEQPAVETQWLGDKTLAVTTPALAAGRVTVSVENPDATRESLARPVIVVDLGEGGQGIGTLKLQSVHPDRGPASGMTRVAIVGGGFQADAAVTIGGASATDVVFRSNTVLLATVPAGVPGPATVTVTQSGSEPANLVGGYTYIDDSLQLTDANPASGPAAGGTRVLLAGRAFAADMQVSFGTTLVDTVELINERAAFVTAPPGLAGPTDITIARDGFVDVHLADAFTYTDDSLTVTAIRPASGSVAGGFEVALIGRGFAEGATVDFGDLAATNVIVEGSDVMRVTVPSHVAGTTDVTVNLPNGRMASLAGGFEFIDDGQGAFTVDAVVPARGPVAGGQPVALTGAGLDRLQSVRFGDAAASILQILSPSVAIVLAPPGVEGVVPVVATSNEGDEVTFSDGYSYEAGVQITVTAVNGITPIAGPTDGGIRVAIHGTGLGAIAAVRIGASNATGIERVGETLITAVTPSGVPGPADVTVVLNDNREVVLRQAFFYYQADSTQSPPILNSVQPTLGPIAGGTPIILSGSRFASGAQVLVGGQAATDIRRLDAQTLTARTPATDRERAVDVAVFHTDGHASLLRGAFAYYRPGSGAPGAPSVTNVSPPSVSTLGGAEVAATGANFRPGAIAFIDGVPGADTLLNSGERISFRVPSHAQGPANITVVNTDGQWGRLTGGLNYVPQPPIITGLLPSEGPEAGFTALTIRGAGFDPNARVRLGSQDAIDVVVLSDSLILAVTPPGVAGAIDVTVTNPGDLSDTATDGFTYFAGNYEGRAPTVTLLSPNRGPFTGGTIARVVGTQLRAGARVLIGSVEAPRVVVLNDTTATITTPPGVVGPVDFAWINPDGQAAIVRNGFTYSDGTGTPPSIGGLTPNRGPSAGGTPTVLAGSGFTQGTEVFFGDSPARSVATLGDGFLSLTTPTHDPGPVSVTVTNRLGFSVTQDAAYTFIASPAILAVQPAVGPASGGTRIQIGGRNFVGGATVLVGGVSAADVQFLSANLVTAITPPAAIGRVDVTVRNPDGQQATLVNGFEYLNAPEISAVWPGSGPSTGGTRVIVRGVNFRNGLRVYFGADEGTEVRWVDNTRATAVVPAGAVGAVDVRVVNADMQETTLTEGFVRVDPADLGPAAAVTSCFPAVGSTEGGTRVRISGQQFQPSAQVFFDGIPGVTGYVDAQALAATTPAHDPETVVVSVTNPDGQTGSRADCFNYTDALGNEPDPIVSAVQPDQGPTLGGADLVITGDYFQEGALVLVGDRLATSIMWISPTRMEAITPPGDVGAADIVVVNPDGKVGILPRAYTYLAPPRITSVMPSEGPSIGGTELIIRGEGFLFGASIRIGGVGADMVAVISDTEIHCLTPPGTPGPAAVSIINSDGQVGQLPAAFVYNAPPVVERIEPPSGSTEGGEWVRVFGSGYRAGLTVDFGLDRSPEVQVLSGTELRVMTPSAPIGVVAITVTNPDGFSATLPGAFTFVPPPSIQTVSPQGGPTSGGVTVTVVGRFFQDGARVYFGTNEATMVTFQNSSILEVVTPARPAGPAAVRVVNPDGQEAILPGGFVYLPPIPPPSIEAVSPNFGPVIGGNPSNVTGRDFQVGARVFFGANEVPSQAVTVISSSQIRVRVPPAALAEAVDVRVLNPDGQEDTYLSGYTYLPALALPPLALSSITPNRTPVEGGPTATVLGNGLASDVQFYAINGNDQIEIPIVTYYSPTAVLVQYPMVPRAGRWDLKAFLPSTQAEVTLAQAIDYRDYALGLETRRGRLPLDARAYDRDTVVTDLNQDGFLDIFTLRIGGSRGWISQIYQNRGAEQPGFFDDVTAVNLLAEPDDRRYDYFQNPMAADFNQDGYPDIVARDTYSSEYDVRMWESEGFGIVRYGRNIANPAGSTRIYEVVAADLDLKDGIDMLVCTASANWVAWNNGIERDGNGDPVLDASGRPNWLGFRVDTFKATIGGTANQVPSEDSRGCRVADVNGDGSPDVIVANAANIANRLYLSNGDPANPAFIDVSNSPQFRVAGNSQSVEVVDLDHDGHLDMVFANLNQDDFVVMNDGAGNFTNQPARLCHTEDCRLADSVDPYLSPTMGVAATSAGSYNRYAGDSFLDINNDGCVDLAVTFDNGNANPDDDWLPRAYINQKIGDAPQGCTGQFYYSAGTDSEFDPVRNLFEGALGAGQKGLLANTPTILADFDNDGWLDLFQAYSGQQNRIYMRETITDARGTYHPMLDDIATAFVPRDLGYNRTGAATDINGDGALDLVVGFHASDCNYDAALTRNRIYLNDGAGNFFDQSDRLQDLDADEATAVILTADFNGDGYDDIMAFNHWRYQCEARFTSQVRYYQNDGFGFFEDRTNDANLPTLGDYYGNINGATAVDVDGDGDQDVVAVGARGCTNCTLYALLINGGDPLGTGAPFFFNKANQLPSTRFMTSTTPIDFDGDGDQDLYVGRESGGQQNALWRNDGRGQYEDVTNIFMQAVSDSTRWVIADYFTGTDRLDIFVVNAGQKRLHASQPDRTFADVTDSSIRFNDGFNSAGGVSADFDMDGQVDVLLGSDNGSNTFYLNIGNGAFQDWSDAVVLTGLSENTQHVVTGDWDNDGDDDAFYFNWGYQNRLVENKLIQ